MTVGLISTDSFGRFTIPIMQGIEERLSDGGVAVFMCNVTDDPAKEARHVEQLLRKRVDGIIVTARRADQRPKLKCPSDIPLVYAFSHVGNPDACCVLPDDSGAPRWLCAIWPNSDANGSPTSPGQSDLKQWSCGETATEER